MKCSKPAQPVQAKKLHGTPLFKEPGYFEEESLDIGMKTNCKKVNIPNLTVYYIKNCRQTEKVEKLVSYVDMKILTQVNRIKYVSEKEIEDAKKEKADSDFVFCTFPEYKEGADRFLGISEHICQSTVLGDKIDDILENGFGGDKKPLQSGYKRSKLPNRFSCTLLSFMKRAIKEGLDGTSKHSETFCYTPQLCDRIEEANRNNAMPYIPFVEVNKETLGGDFYPPDFISSTLEKKLLQGQLSLTLLKSYVKKIKKDLITTLTISLSFYQVTDNFLSAVKNIMIIRTVE